MAFDFKRHLIKVQGGRQYLPVSARLIWFRQEHPDWGIETELLEINHEKQYAMFRARIYNAEGKLMAMGTKKEDIKGFGDYIEKAETGAVGRALALCGYGTQFSPELDEVGGGRFTDSPQPIGGNRFSSSGGYNGGNRFGSDSAPSSGGVRFTPPLEGSSPAHDEAPARPAPTRNEAPPQPTSVREEAPVRPAGDTAGRRPAPVVSDEDDDFEALLGDPDARNASDEDPFGGDEVQNKAPILQSTPAPKTATAAPAGGPPACITCGKALTKAQQDLSIRNYGEALCPSCQKERGRTERPVAAAR